MMMMDATRDLKETNEKIQAAGGLKRSQPFHHNIDDACRIGCNLDAEETKHVCPSGCMCIPDDGVPDDDDDDDNDDMYDDLYLCEPSLPSKG